MNILQTKTEAYITPTKPKILSEERIYVYVPLATSTNAGIASYNENDFIVTRGNVALERNLKDAYDKPELIMLDSNYFPRDSILHSDGNTYFKYKTSAIHYNIEQDLTAQEKERARNNIDAITLEAVTNLLVNYYSKAETYNKNEINNLLTTLPKFGFKIVEELPTNDISTTTIYLVVKDDSEPDVYDEYIYIDNKWELLGSQKADVIISAETVSEVIEDSDTVIVMIENDKIKFNLSNEINNKLARSLVTPKYAPSSLELVGIDDTNSQTMITIGNGLKLEDGVLKADSEGKIDAVVVDSLTSTSSVDALSAKQGNVLYQMAIAAGTKINENELLVRKPILLGADGVLINDKYNFEVNNADAFIDYRTNLTRFLVDLHLPLTGDLDTTNEVTITFGDTSYYVHNILKGMDHVTIGDLRQVSKYNNETGYRFICEMMFFKNDEIEGFAIIPTISMSDILSLDSDQMDNYVTDSGLKQGQLAICNKVINNGYTEGALYRFDITYPDTYAWTELSGAGSGVIIRRWEE